MKKSKQLNLLRQQDIRFFGGVFLNGRRKSQRPLSHKHPIHLVLRSDKAKGAASFFRFRKQIEIMINTQAKKFGVKVYQQAIQSNHIHFVMKIHNRELYRYFICALTGAIALRVSRGAGLKKQNKTFWLARPFTRIVNWGRDYRGVLKYLVQNTLEALGFIPYTHRTDYYKRFVVG